MNDPFVRDPSEYVRDLDVLENYKRVTAQYIADMTGHDLAAVRAKLDRNLAPKDPTMRIYARRTGADRVKERCSFTNYLKEAQHTGRLVGPNLIMYENPDRKLGFLPKFIKTGLERRKVVKKQGQAAAMAGDMATAVFCDNQQATIKILNNSISGAHASPHNPVYNSSAHTTLTTVCRCATSYSNAVAERLLGGNRHYFEVNVVLEEMAAISAIQDLERVERCIERYGLAVPDPETIMQYIQRSTKRYWRSDMGNDLIRKYVYRMTPAHRAAFMYTLDLNAVRILNDDFMRGFIGALADKPTQPTDEPELWHGRADDALTAMVGLIMSEELDGRSVKDMIKESPEHYPLYAAAIRNAMESLEHYREFIDVFLRSDYMPPRIYNIPTVLRDIAIVSDTDSTLFTTEDWVTWYFGVNRFDRPGMSVAGVMAYLDYQALKHVLAMLSRHLGVKDRDLFMLAMKTEFYQPVLGVANLTKHYFSYIKACEGDVYPKPKLDLKGVNLKNSRLPDKVRHGLEDFIRHVMDNVMHQSLPTTMGLLEGPVRMAHEIQRVATEGEPEFLASMQVKGPKAYRKPLSSNYIFYLIWQDVFAPHYGDVDVPPFGGIKIPVKLTSKRLLCDWIESLDEPMRSKMRRWTPYYEDEAAGGLTLDSLRDNPMLDAALREYKEDEVDLDGQVVGSKTVDIRRSGFTQFIIPRECLRDGHIPKELIPIVDTARIEDELMAGYQVMLETCGIYWKNKSRSRLLSDEIPLSEYV